MTNLNDFQDAWELLNRLESEGYRNGDFKGGSFPAMKLSSAKRYIIKEMQSYLAVEAYL